MKVFKSLSARELYARDQGELPSFLSSLFSALPAEVVQPESAEETLEAVQAAARSGLPLVARGAGSTAFGQTAPVLGGLVLDLSFLKGVGMPDPASETVVVESGARWADVSALLAESGLALRTYPSSWSSTVGGWIATGGIGINSLAFGPLKGHVASLRVAAKDGQDLRLEPGDPLFDAYFETEGQMGVVLSARLKVRRPGGGARPFLIPCPGRTQAWSLYAEACAAGLGVLHAAVLNPVRTAHLNHTLEAKMERKGSGIKGPFEEAWTVLACLEGDGDASRFSAWLKDRGARPAPAYQAAYAWEERFYPLKGRQAGRLFLGNEIRIENARADAYAADLERLSEAEGLGLAIEASAASPTESLVIASFYVPDSEEGRLLGGLAAVLKLDELGCVRHGGRLYHVGVYNTPFIARKFGAKRLAELRGAKAELDTKGIFNPGKFFELKTSRTRRLSGALQLWGARLLLPLLKSPALGRVLLRLARPWLGPAPKPRRERGPDAVLRTAGECVNCGFCLPVCPAYLATRDERTTARGKLFLARKWIAGGELSAEDAALLHSCMHCGACTKVCQSTLDLVPAWYELESRVAAVLGRPEERIKEFVKDVESSPDYYRLLRRGYITETRAAAE